MVSDTRRGPGCPRRCCPVPPLPCRTDEEQVGAAGADHDVADADVLGDHCGLGHPLHRDGQRLEGNDRQRAQHVGPGSDQDDPGRADPLLQAGGDERVHEDVQPVGVAVVRYQEGAGEQHMQRGSWNNAKILVLLNRVDPLTRPWGVPPGRSPT